MFVRSLETHSNGKVRIVTRDTQGRFKDTVAVDRFPNLATTVTVKPAKARYTYR